LTLSACVSYSSRWEVTKAAKSIAEDVKAGILSVDQITEELLSKKMVTYPMPDPDLLIRSGGEERISNYLLWQIAYSELYFTDTLWPDFGKEKFVDALIDYQQRERRYGKTSDQVSK
jgi:undecaprenyl diphosphate synthase